LCPGSSHASGGFGVQTAAAGTSKGNTMTAIANGRHHAEDAKLITRTISPWTRVASLSYRLIVGAACAALVQLEVATRRS
jgi:hypothetical protein